MPPVSQIRFNPGAEDGSRTADGASSGNSGSSNSVTSTITANNGGTNKKTNKGDRHVQFKSNVRVRKVSSHKTFTDSERAAAWWSPKESKQIRANAVETVKKMMKGIDVDDPEFEGIDCSRGLEFKSPKKNKVRQKKKQVILWAVIDEQDRWAEDNGHDSDSSLNLEEIKDRDNCIAEIYTSKSTTCQTEAFSRGLKDAYIAAKCWEKASSTSSNKTKK